MTQSIRQISCTVSLVLALSLALAFAATPSFAQTPVPPPVLTTPIPLPTNFAGVQVGLQPTQHLTGGLNWGHHVTGSLWSFTRVDVIGFSRNPIQAQTLLTVGACDIPHQFFSGRLLLGWCLDGGLSETNDGTSVHIGNALGTDGLALFRLGKKQNIGVGVMGGWVQTNLTPAGAAPNKANGALTPVRVVLEYGFGNS